MTILLTGCAGFIGARTAEILLGEDHKVVGIDNLNDYYDVRLKEHRLASLISQSNFSFHAADIEDGLALDEIFNQYRFDAVINLAARAGVRSSIVEPHVYLTTNTQGALNLLQRMTRHGINRYVMASTSSLYAGAPMPFDETADVTRPISPYAATKLAAEALAYTWHHLHGIDVAILRYFTVFGPAGRPDMSPFRFIEWIRRGLPITLYGDGNQTRDFTYIDDIARGTIAALKIQGYEIINLGGGNEPLSINSMIRTIEDTLHLTAIIDYQPQNNADMQDTAATITKAKTLIGWEPSIAPKEGFQKTIAWHQSNAGWLSDIKL
ncbi:MAG: NAD-dependent epimerase/dehydratase family protein [Akkermansiaceae bacterium]|nr:NAD-dependent epimerase/dehydratase family protein [Akkermansiaceae bacterium]